MLQGVVTLAIMFAIAGVLIPLVRALKRWEERQSTDTTLTQHIDALLAATPMIHSARR